MADLSQLYRVAPNTAAFMTGGQQATDDQRSLLDQQQLQQIITGLQQSNQQASQMNPLLLQHQDLLNQTDQARLPGVTADSTAKQQGVNYTTATQPLAISATNANNTNDVLNKNIAGANAVKKLLTDTAGEMEQAPPPARQGILMGALQRAHLDPADPSVAPLLKVLNDVPAEHLPLALNHMADTLTAHSPEYKKATDVANIEATSRQTVGAGNNTATVDAARILAQSRVDAAGIRANNKTQLDKLIGQHNYAGAAAAAQVMATFETDPTIKAQYQNIATTLAAQDLASKQAGASGPNKVDVPGMTGLPSAQTPNPIGAANAGSASVTPAAPAANLVNSNADQRVPPPEAIQKLRQNPQMRGAFDQWYGPGASAKVLGN